MMLNFSRRMRKFWQAFSIEGLKLLSSGNSVFSIGLCLMREMRSGI